MCSLTFLTTMSNKRTILINNFPIHGQFCVGGGGSTEITESLSSETLENSSSLKRDCTIEGLKWEM